MKSGRKLYGNYLYYFCNFLLYETAGVFGFYPILNPMLPQNSLSQWKAPPSNRAHKSETKESSSTIPSPLPHAQAITKSCQSHFLNISQIYLHLPITLIQTTTISHLGYYNNILIGLSTIILASSLISYLQHKNSLPKTLQWLLNKSYKTLHHA